MQKLILLSLAVLMILSSCKLRDPNPTSTNPVEPGVGDATIKVVLPNGGETLSEGDSYPIQWTGTGTLLVRIQYSIDNGTSWGLVVDSLKNTGIYNWFPVPNTISNQVLIMITSLNGVSSDRSDKVFAIVKNSNESLKINSPNGGESWEAGSAQQIKWYSSGLDSVKLQYTTDNGQHWNLIAVDKKNTGIYYWDPIPNTSSTLAKIRIMDAKDGIPSTESTNPFTILPEAKITVLLPNGNDTWLSGSNQEIKWTAVNIVDVKIEFTTNAGGTWNTIVNSTPNTGSYMWNNIPDANNSLNCRIKISKAGSAIPFDLSDDNFAIMNPGAQQIKVTSPNGGEIWPLGLSQNITWDAGGIANVKIEFTTNNGNSWNTIIASTPSNGFYKWTQVPYTQVTNCKIRISDASDGSPYDDSDQFFSIGTAPSLKVSVPNGNDTWLSGSNKEIKWTSENVVDVKIEFTTNAGGNWTTIVSSTPSIGTYMWNNIPDANNSLQCRIKISDAVYGTPSDLSDDNFAIMNPGAQQIKVTSPIGGEKWIAGSSQQITWDAGGIANVKIEFTTNNGNSWNTITASTPSNGFYTWNQVPNTLSTNCKIRISDALDGAPSDDSNQFFSIVSAPDIKVTSPNGGETIQSGTNYKINYTSENVENVKIEYTINGGAVWNTIISSTLAVGNYEWTNVPSTNSSQCKIKVSDAQNGTPFDISDQNFQITNLVVRSIKILSPNGGEDWEAGTKQNITWTSSAVPTVKVELTTDQGSSWIVLANNITGGAFEWNIDITLNSTQCQIRVSDATDNTVSNISNGTFTISPIKSITVTAPTGPITYKDSDPITIEWVSSGIKFVGIRYTTTNGVGRYPDVPQFYTLVSKIANQGSYTTSFSLPSSEYYVVVYNADDGANEAPSARNIGNFTIVKTETPSITLIAPNGNEQWLASPSNISTSDVNNYHPYEIRWNSTGLQKVKIEWSTTGGGSWYTVPGADSTTSDGSFTWAPGRLESNIGNPRPDSSDNCLIRISNLSGSFSSRSNKSFSIHESKKIRIDSPNGGEYFYVTADELADTTGLKSSDHWPLPVYWTSYAISGNVNIYYSIQNGAAGTWIPLIMNYPSTGAYGWDFIYGVNAELTPSSLLRFKIEDAADNKIWDTNDGPVNLHIIKTN